MSNRVGPGQGARKAQPGKGRGVPAGGGIRQSPCVPTSRRVERISSDLRRALGRHGTAGTLHGAELCSGCPAKPPPAGLSPFPPLSWWSDAAPWSGMSPSFVLFDPQHRHSRSPTRWLYPALLAVTILLASGRGQVAAPAVVNLDKAVHFLVFGLMASLVVRSPGGGRGWLAVVGVSLFGGLDEWRQGLTPGRSVEGADWLADTAGAVVAVLLYTGWPWYRRLLESRPLAWWLRWRGGRGAGPRGTLRSSADLGHERGKRKRLRWGA